MCINSRGEEVSGNEIGGDCKRSVQIVSRKYRHVERERERAVGERNVDVICRVSNLKSCEGQSEGQKKKRRERKEKERCTEVTVMRIKLRSNDSN
jgi:hypothetical protein